MIEYCKNISVMIIVSIFIVYISCLMQSVALFSYLKDNLLTILLAFLAINTATLGHLSAKIQDIIVEYKNLDFTDTIREMKKSLLEQIILIILTVILIIVDNGENVQFKLKTELLYTFFLAIFIYALDILWDTGKSVFIIVDEINKINKK